MTGLALCGTLTLGLTGGALALAIVFGVLVVVALVASLFPAIRRSNALFAPVLVLLTLAGTGLVLAGLLYVMHTKMG
ncbi:MAG: hypothetical protein JNK35_06745 [Phycisphaerae bacterium]|nr:hypothetical protein [Phycisphaerae bacterium]